MEHGVHLRGRERIVIIGYVKFRTFADAGVTRKLRGKYHRVSSRNVADERSHRCRSIETYPKPLLISTTARQFWRGELLHRGSGFCERKRGSGKPGGTVLPGIINNIG